MNQVDRKNWMDKSVTLNENVELKLGLTVKDAYGNLGVVVKMVEPETDVEGAIYVWQQDKVGYGGDNCEHYSSNSWKQFLRVQDEGFYPTNKKPKI